MKQSLRSAFDGLIGVASPDQSASVLRQALISLFAIQDSAAATSTPSSGPPVPARKSRSWRPSDLGSSSRTDLGLADCPRDNPLGIDRRGQDRPPDVAALVVTERQSISRGYDGSTNGSRGSAARSESDEPKPNEPPAPPPYKLTAAQRERLAGWREPETEQNMRTEIGVAWRSSTQSPAKSWLRKSSTGWPASTSPTKIRRRALVASAIAPDLGLTAEAAYRAHRGVHGVSQRARRTEPPRRSELQGATI